MDMRLSRAGADERVQEVAALAVAMPTTASTHCGLLGYAYASMSLSETGRANRRDAAVKPGKTASTPRR